MGSNLMNSENKMAWWKKWHIWLIITGPLVVVIASFYTLYLAITIPDPAIDDYYRKGLEINKTLNARSDNMAPAQQARNHAATGIAQNKSK